MTAFTMWGISDIVFMRNTEEIIMLQKACKLLFLLAKKHGMSYLYITCNPDNLPSRRICEYLQGEFLGVADLPEDNDMRINKGKTQMCIFKFNL